MQKIIGINHCTILVNDKEKAVGFYCDILGLEKIQIGKSIWAKAGNQYIHISKSSQILPRSFVHFAIEIQDINEYLQRLVSMGVSIFSLDESLNKIQIDLSNKNNDQQFFIEDPSGNLVEIISSTNPFFHP